VIGVVLTGARDDGAVGMRAIKQRGGIAIVQDPEEATFPIMPMSVMQQIQVDYSLSLREIAPLLNKLCREEAAEDRARQENHARVAAIFERRAQEAERNSNVIRQVLLADEKGAIGEPVNEKQDELRVS
jgi:two-component system chemotaxis response regulator CheB